MFPEHGGGSQSCRFASNGALHQKFRLVGKLVTEFVRCHMAIDPAVQRRPKIRSHTDSSLDKVPPAQALHHAGELTAAVQAQGIPLRSLGKHKNALDDAASVPAIRKLKQDQSQGHTAADCSIADFARGFCGCAYLQSRPESLPQQLGSAISAGTGVNCRQLGGGNEQGRDVGTGTSLFDHLHVSHSIHGRQHVLLHLGSSGHGKQHPFQTTLDQSAMPQRDQRDQDGHTLKNLFNYVHRT